MRTVMLALLLLLPAPAGAVPVVPDQLVMAYCSLGALAECVAAGAPLVTGVVEVALTAAPVHLLERWQATAIGLPLGLAMDYFGLLTQEWYSTDWLYWGPFGLGIGQAVDSIALFVPDPPADDPAPTETPEPATLTLTALTLAAWGVWRRRCAR